VGNIKLHAFLTLPLDGEAHSAEGRHLYFEEKSLDTVGNRAPGSSVHNQSYLVSVLIYLVSKNELQ
jgi:hypothetical protein